MTAKVKPASKGKKPTKEKYSSKSFAIKYCYKPDPGMTDRSTSFGMYERIIYLADFWQKAASNPIKGIFFADTNFMETSAHEIGHPVLNDSFGAKSFSWIHKGTSTLMQNHNSDSPKHIPTRETGYYNGEIDLMEYFTGTYLSETAPSYVIAADNCNSSR